MEAVQKTQVFSVWTCALSLSLVLFVSKSPPDGAIKPIMFYHVLVNQKHVQTKLVCVFRHHKCRYFFFAQPSQSRESRNTCFTKVSKTWVFSFVRFLTSVHFLSRNEFKQQDFNRLSIVSGEIFNATADEYRQILGTEVSNDLMTGCKNMASELNEQSNYQKSF